MEGTEHHRLPHSTGLETALCCKQPGNRADRKHKSDRVRNLTQNATLKDKENAGTNIGAIPFREGANVLALKFREMLRRMTFSRPPIDICTQISWESRLSEFRL